MIESLLMLIILLILKIDFILKVTQIMFFIVAGTLAILTYIKAKKGLLNTINTEYQKKAMIKVEEFSNFLISEFDHDSDNFWVKNYNIIKSIETMVNDYQNNVSFLNQHGSWRGPIPVDPSISKLENWVKKVKSDPFVPKILRDLVVEYFENRVDVTREVFREEFENFGNSLIMNPPKTFDAKMLSYGVHNKINKRLIEKGFGVSQVEEKVHALRDAIQSYYERYDPFN